MINPIKKIASICENCETTQNVFEVRTEDPTRWDELCPDCIRLETKRWIDALAAIRDLNL